MLGKTVVRAGFKFQDTGSSEILEVNKVEIDLDDDSDTIIWYKTDPTMPYSHFMYQRDLDRDIASGKLVEYDHH